MNRTTVADLYILSPIQKGILFHVLYNPESGMYFEQFSWTFHSANAGSTNAGSTNVGSTNVAAFARAWQQVLDRHPILRTAFYWEGLDEPMQMVQRRVQLPLEQHDWRELPAHEQDARLETYLKADRQRGFDLSTAPLLRLTLIQVSEDSYHFILSYHHLLLDGWSLMLVLKEVFTLYEAFCQGQKVSLQPSRPYRDYITWLRRQDLAEAETFWRTTLGGFSAPTPLRVDRETGSAPSTDEDLAKQDIQLSVATTTALQTLTRQQHLTFNTLIQGAWALLLSCYSGETDVVYGTTVSGRPPDLVGSEAMVGLFINTLPMRVRIAPEMPLLAWLQQFQKQQVELRAYEYTPLVELQRWSDVPSGLPLFESIVVFEKFPIGSAGNMRNLRVFQRTNYPLTVMAEPAQTLLIRISYERRRFDPATITQMLRQLQTVLEHMAADPEQRLMDLPLLTAAQRQQLLVEWNDTSPGVRDQGSGVSSRVADACLHELFEAQVARTPDAIAVVFDFRDKQTGRQADKQLTRDQGSGIRDQDSRVPAPDPRPLNPEPCCLTYAELDRRANQLAQHLHALAVGPDVRVAICMDRSLELVIGLLGILKAGAAYVPLDPAYPPERLAYMLEDSQARVLITTSIYDLRLTIDDLEESQTPIVNRKSKIVNLPADWPVIARAPSEPLRSSVRPDNLAYVIYTSGSTGTPKGAMNTHRAIVNRLLWMQETYRLTPADCVLQKTPFSFDVSVWEFFWPLLSGARLVLAQPGEHKDSAYLVALIARSQITTLHFVPSMLQAFLEEPALTRCASLRRVICSGEALPYTLQERFFARLDVPLHNLYGPTEAAVDVSWWACLPGDPRQVVPIGRPITNIRLYVLDRQMQPLAIGVPGELHIGGVGLARGYLDRPELTAERFVPNPFAGDKETRGQGDKETPQSAICNLQSAIGTRLYRTGDLVRYRADGAIEFLGRIDYQVKLRGFRIELGEIEAALGGHPAVREVVVLARADAPGDQRLVAYVVPVQGSAVRDQGSEVETAQGSEVETARRAVPTPDPRSLIPDLRAFLSEKLPDYMVPTTFVLLDALPLTHNGKLDRRALPAPEQAAIEPQAPILNPRTPIEEMLISIWTKILGVKQVGIHDSFFALGGHSLLATRLFSRLRETFEVDLPLRTIFEARTIAGLAKHIERALQDGQGLHLPALRPVPRDGHLPLSFAQQRLWVLDQLQPHSPLYVVPAALRLHGPLDRNALQRSLSVLVQRHEPLRTRFVSVDGQPVQQIASNLPLPLAVVDLQALPVAARELEAERLAATEAQRPFDLAVAPLLRVTVLQMEPVEQVVLLSMHHIISDGWSLGVLTHDLAAAYAAMRTGQPLTLPALACHYADYALWQREQLQGPALDQLLAYWTRQLAGAPARLDLPTDRLRPSAPTYVGASRTVLLPQDLLAALNDLAGRQSLTLFMPLLATFAITLARWTQQHDLVIGTVVANRTRAEIEPLIGCFMNFLPLRVQLAPDQTASALLTDVKTMLLDAYAHQDCPFEKLVEVLNPDRGRGHNPIYNVALLLQNVPAAPRFSPDLVVEALPSATQTAQLNLRLVATETPQGLDLTFEYSTDLFDSATIDALLHAYQLALEQLVRQPETPVDAFALPSELLAQAEAARQREEQQTLAISATFTAEPLEDALAFWMAELGLPARIVFAPYNQVFQQLLEPGSLFATTRTGIKILLVRFEDWYRFLDPTAEVATPIEVLLEQTTAELIATLQSASAQSSGTYLLYLCPPSPAVTADAQRAAQLRRLEATLVAALAPISGVYVCTPDTLAATYPVDEIHDPYSDELGHIPYTPLFFAALGTAITRTIAALRRPPYKVIVLDGDNTLWQGVCAEEGVDGIAIDAPRRALQEFMLAQQRAGMLLGLCSKNDPADVDAIFDTRTDMVLQREHFVAQQINWRPKSENLKALADELQLGLDSFIFLDDNPVECAEVQAACPEVLVLQLPEVSTQIPTFLAHVWAFDHLQITEADRQRTLSYQQNAQRAQLRQTALSFADFLDRLALEVTLAPLSLPQIARVAQLTQRTNQFNLTTIRRTEAELVQLLHGGEQECLTVHVRDRFGDYGLVGVVIFADGADVLTVETFLLSCRVLGRGVELRVVAALGDRAEARGQAWVELRYLPTSRNQPAYAFLESIATGASQPWETGLRYRLPAATAAKLVYCPDQGTALPAAGETPTSAPSAAMRTDRAQLVWIANQLNDAEIIAQQIASYGQTRPRPHAAPAAVPPRTPLEAQLAAIWAEVLRLETVGIYDNFFALGGHSLLGTRLLARIHDACQVALPLQSLFEHPTIAGMAQIIEQAPREPNEIENKPIPALPIGEKGFVDLLDEIEQLSDVLEHLSDEEALELLGRTDFENS